MLWQSTSFLLLQQWFSTISRNGAKSRPPILLESSTEKFYHKSIDTFCVIALTKSVTQNIQCYWKTAKSRTKDAWELHAALTAMFENYCSTSNIKPANYDVIALAMNKTKETP